MEAGNRSKVIAIDIEPAHMPSTRMLLLPQSASAPGDRMPKSGSRGSATARCTGSEDAMITATANLDRQATICLLVRGPDEQEREIEAVVEGFNCFITLPPAFTIPLGLTSSSSTRGD